MPLAARLTDIDSPCPIPYPPHPPTPIVSCASKTIIEGLPAARMGDSLACGASIIKGSMSVMIEGKPAARLGDPCAHGSMIAKSAVRTSIGG